MKNGTNKTTKADRDVVDVPADNPEGTMERFTAGLKRVMEMEKRRDEIPPPKKLRRPRSA